MSELEYANRGDNIAKVYNNVFGDSRHARIHIHTPNGGVDGG